jgi:hypothetical protein
MQREEELERAHLERLHTLDEAHRRRSFRRSSFLAMWAQAALRAPRRAEKAPLPAVARGQLGVTFIGHATVLLRYHDARILTDPNLGHWLLGLRRASW